MRLLLLLLCLAVFLSGCSLKATPPVRPSPSPEASPLVSYVGWQEYRSERYGYTIKYPHDWYLLTAASPAVIQLANVPEDKLSGPHVTVEISVAESLGKTLKDYEEIQNLISQGSVARNLKISNAPAVLIDNLGEDGDLASIYVESNQYIYRLGWNGTQPDVRSQFEDTCLKIIASFKFF